MLEPSQLLAPGIAVIATVIAAATDLRHGTIPNRLTLPLLVAAPLAHGLLAGPGALLTSIAGLLACGVTPAVMFAARAMGGGDVKLLAALGALLGPRTGLAVELIGFLIAALSSLVWLARRGQLADTVRSSARVLVAPLLPRRFRQQLEPLDDRGRAAQIRLGPAILIATVWVLARGATA